MPLLLERNRIEFEARNRTGERDFHSVRVSLTQLDSFRLTLCLVVSVFVSSSPACRRDLFADFGMLALWGLLLRDTSVPLATNLLEARWRFARPGSRGAVASPDES